jgi:hypothetical protein
VQVRTAILASGTAVLLYTSGATQTIFQPVQFLRRIPPYTEEMLNPSVFPPFLASFGHFLPFLAIFGHCSGIFWTFLTFMNEVKKKNPPFFG